MGNKKKTAEKQAETVTISRAEYEELKLQNQWLLEQLGLAKKRQFGSSSERIQEGLMDQLGLTLNEAEAYAFGTKSATPEQIAVKAHARKRKSGNVLDVVPEGTPTEVVEHRLPEEEQVCEVCGTRATTGCRRISVWLGAGHTHDENLMKRCKHCPKKNRRTLRQRLENATAPGYLSWRRLLQN